MHSLTLSSVVMAVSVNAWTVRFIFAVCDYFF